MKILIVDEEQKEAERLQAVVQEFGHTAILTYTAEQAIAAAVAETPDIAIIDTRLPDRPGLDLFRSLRRKPQTRQMFVILANPDTSDEELFFGFNYCSDAHWSRPIEADLLRKVLTLFAEEPDAPDKSYDRFAHHWNKIWDAENDEDYSLEKPLPALRQRINRS